MVVARSPDVVFDKDEAENIKKIEVVEPKLKLVIDGPDQRFTDTVADYKITLENPGTAAARKVRVLATLPISGRLVKYPPEARYDKTTSKLYWTIDQIDPGPKSMTFTFQVRMGGIGSYEVIADAIGEGVIKQHERKTTDVIGMPDVDLVVSESKRVLDVERHDNLPDPLTQLRHQGRHQSAGFSRSFAQPQVRESRRRLARIKVKYSPKENSVKFIEDRQARARTKRSCWA